MPLHSSPESAPRQTVPGGVLTALTARLGAVAAVGLGRVKSAIDLRGSQQPYMDTTQFAKLIPESVTSPR